MVLFPAMTIRAVLDFERMTGHALKIAIDWKGTRP